MLFRSLARHAATAPDPDRQSWPERWKAGLGRLQAGWKRPPTTSGHLDRWNGSELIGWAVDSRHAGAPVEVLVKLDGRVIARSRADSERADVAEALGEQFLHSGFHVALDALPDDARTLSVHVGGTLLHSIALPASGGHRKG